MCPICLLDGQTEAEIHHYVRHLHQDSKYTFQLVCLIFTFGVAREYLVEEESSLHDEHYANIKEEAAYFSCALFDLLSFFICTKLIQSLLMITFQFPVNINVCKNEKAADDNTLAD